MKSILEILEVQNLAFFFTHLKDVNLIFYEFLPFLKAVIYQINKIPTTKHGKKKPDFALLESPKLISRKI